MCLAQLDKLFFLKGLEQNLEDQLEIEYSPTYWLNNNTVVPTTTQRATTSTSQKSVHNSIFSTSMSSNNIERITERGSVDDEVDEANEVHPNGASELSQVTLTSMIVISMLKAMF